MKTPSFQTILAYVLVPLLVAGGVVGYVGVLKSEERSKLLDQFSPVTAPENDAILTDDAVLLEYIKSYGPAPTMKVIIAASDRQRVECHDRAHQFGRMSYEVYDDEVLKLILPECHSGFYHGAIEAYFRKNGTDHLSEKLSYICPSTLNAFYMHQCRHGLGHGLMAWSGYELLDTLDYCGMIDEPGGKASCRTGAFMENIVGSLTGAQAKAIGHSTKYLSVDPQYPCSVVKEEYKADCYFLQTDQMLRLSKTGFQGIADGCAQAPEAYHYTCFASMGRTIGGITRGRPQEALAACQLIPDHVNRVRCIDAIAKDALWDVTGQDDGLAFCAIVPPEDGQTECYLGLLFFASSVLTPEQLEPFCRRIPPSFYDECMRPPA